MGHNINEKRMFCVGKCWHNEGVRVDKELTAVEAIAAARLNYEVLKLPAMVQHNGQNLIIPDTYSIVRADNNVVFQGTVGSKYQIVQNIQAFNFVDDIVGSGQAIYHSAGALGLGEKIWLLVKLPTTTILFNGHDVNEEYLLFTNCHDGSGSVKMYWTAVRVVCQNTLNISLRDKKNGVSIRHSGNINNKIKLTKEILGFALQYRGEFSGKVKAFAEKNLNTGEQEKYFEQVLNVADKTEEEKSTRSENVIKELERIADSGRGTDIQGVKGTLWGAYNAVTEYIDHERNVRGGTENKTESILFGAGARLKENAYNVAVAML